MEIDRDLYAEEVEERWIEDDPDVVHIVGDIQHWLDRLGLRVPRALCGESMAGDPDRPELGPDAPVCPRCMELAGWI